MTMGGGEHVGFELFLIGEPPPLKTVLWQMGPIAAALGLVWVKSRRFAFGRNYTEEVITYFQITALVHFFCFVY